MLDKIRSTGMGGISADDSQTIAELESKLSNNNAGIRQVRERIAALKSNGFRWDSSMGTWQRQSNGNAIFAAGMISCIRPLTGESPYELQERVRVERQMEAGNSEPVPEENSLDETDQDNGMCMG